MKRQYKETAECKNLYDMIFELHKRIDSLEDQNSTMIRLLGHLDSKLGNLSNEDEPLVLKEYGTVALDSLRRV